jgi:NADP-dependent 3-hydroxy acid dehydrogenase YdfG
MKLVLTDVDEIPLNKVKKELEKEGVDVYAFVADVRNRNQIEQLAEEAYKKFGKVNILCNNAGVLSGGPIHLLSLSDWDWVLDVNVIGVINCIKSFLKRMLESGEPCHIMNTASVAGLLTDPKAAPYGVSKHAVVTISEMLLQQYFNTNVNFSVLCPSYVRTELFRNSIKLGQDKSNILNPSGEMKEAAEILKSGFFDAIDNAISSDYIARKVVEAIRQNIFYIITHPELMPEVEGRFERMKEDAKLLNRDNFVSNEELFGDLIVYKHLSPNFSFEYPKLCEPFKLPENYIVKFAVNYGSNTFSILISEENPKLKLEDAVPLLSDYIGMFGTDINLVDKKEILLSNGITPALECEFEFRRSGFIRMKSICLSVLLEKKLVILRATTFPHLINENVRNIISTFKIN